ncbi:hypothetical protein ACJX0J_020586, partial [Zea mays]
LLFIWIISLFCLLMQLSKISCASKLNFCEERSVFQGMPITSVVHKTVMMKMICNHFIKRLFANTSIIQLTLAGGALLIAILVTISMWLMLVWHYKFEGL